MELGRKKRVLVTGASGNVGSAIATYFRDREWEVFAAANTKQVPVVGITAMEKNLLLPNSGRELVSATKPHLIVNCAADQSAFPLDSKDEINQIAADLLRLNLTAPLEIMSAAARSGTKVVINISSIEALRAKPGHALYGASKAALESLTRSAAVELAPMRVLALRLGLIERKGIEVEWPDGVASWNALAPLKRMGSSYEIARVIGALAEDDFQWASGTVIDLDGGASAAPGW
jgi:NAD(P)-dependent dehydrogenase (short-subunit alcohol dehydrogenase family)